MTLFAKISSIDIESPRGGPSSQVERARRAVWTEDHVWPLDGQCPTGGHVRNAIGNAPLEVFVLGVVLALP